jgi:hypothetical protein
MIELPPAIIFAASCKKLGKVPSTLTSKIRAYAVEESREHK